MQFRVHRLVPVVVLATIAGVFVPVRGAAQQASVCDQAIAEAGTGQGTYGRYQLVLAPAVGRSGSQVVVGTAGPDRLVGGSGNDVLCGLGGDDVLDGGSGNDYLDGGDGNDELQGGSGNDVLDGAGGFDRLFGGSGSDRLRNGEVNDGGSGADQDETARPVDISGTMPRVMRDELTADFLDKGYDQRMRAETDKLNIYDSANRSSANTPLQSTELDLSTGGTGVAYPEPVACGPGQGDIRCHVAFPWAQHGKESTSECQDCFENYWNTFHLATIYLARNNTNLFMAGTKGNAFFPSGGQTTYQNLVYVLPPDGSCASQSCADAVVGLPTLFDPCGSNCTARPPFPRSDSVTSLAAGYVGQTPYLAVGLSDGGVQIYNVSVPSSPVLTGTFGGMATGDGSQTPPTAMAWDPSRSGRLAIGVISWSNLGFVVKVNADGSLPGSWTTWSQQGGSQLTTGALSAAWGQAPDGSPVVAFGLNDGTLQLIDPSGSGMTDTLAQSSPVNGVIAINPIPTFDGSSGGSDFAVSYQSTPGANMVGNGGLLRWDGTGGGLTALNVTTGSTPTVTADWNSFRKWYPGIKQGRFHVENSSGEPISVTLHANSDSASGCWYAPSWADAPAFPTATEGIMVPAGQTSAIYTMGAYTAGTDGSCAATDNTDIWRGYLVITPVNHPVDASLVRLRLNADMSVDVENQAGGETSVSVAQPTSDLGPQGQQLGGAFGRWTVTVDTPSAPTPLSAPTVTGSRVTPEGMPGPAVYRFDVGAFSINGATVGSPATFQLANPYANQMVVPPLVVQGSVDGTTWTELGTLVPATAPTIVTSGSQSELQLGPATFWWENPVGEPDYTQIRVGFADPGTTNPTSVTLADLSAPPALTNVSGPEIGQNLGPTGAATPVDSGTDQYPLSVQVLDSNSQPLEGAPNHERIYYRDVDSDGLITNLFLAGLDPSAFIGVNPYAGASPNSGSAGQLPPGTFDGHHYVATTSTIDQQIIGYLAIDATPPAFSQTISVRASAISPQNITTTSAMSGISLSGCEDFDTNTCRLAPITTTTTGTGTTVTPAHYLDTSNGLQIGLLTVAQATTSVGSLPLQHANGTAEHLLATAPLTMSDGTATLTDTSAFQQGDSVDTNLVTHGMFVTGPAGRLVGIPVF